MSEIENIDKQVEKRRKKRKRKKRRKKFFKKMLVFLGILIIALAVAVALIKHFKPDYDFAALVPESVVTFVGEDVFTKTTVTSEPQSQTSQTTAKVDDYLPIEEFDFNLSKQGNHLGNLLGKGQGKVGMDASFIYHIVDKKGIYRFSPSTEDYALVYKSTSNLSCLNLRGNYIYFINNDNHNLYRLQKETSKAEVIASGVCFSYVYDSSIYYLTDNTVCVMDVSKPEPNVIYTSNDSAKLDFVGISLNKVFFTKTSDTGGVKYLCVDIDSKNEVSDFRKEGDVLSIVSMQLENGFFYYYQLQPDSSYNLCRQKFGSKNIVTILENVDNTDYVIIDSNRLYYGELIDSKYSMKEYNMNADSKRTLITVNSVKKDNTLAILHGDEYDFVIGKKSKDGSYVYDASCIYTSSTNVMSFKDGKWKY